MSTPSSAAELLRELIRIPSVNPDAVSGEPAAGEGDCARRVGEFLRSCGAEVRFEEVLPGRPNVCARFPGGEGKPGLLLAPHTDTVGVRGMTVDPFGGEVRAGRIHGRGASDTKGTMAAMLWALRLMQERIPRLRVAVGFAGLMGEEAGQPGSKHFAAAHGGEYGFAVVGEPTGLDTVHAHKGCTWVELRTRGRACHGSTPWRGDNAVRKMLRVLDSVLPRLESALPRFSDPVLGDPTVNLSILDGGSGPNVVPDACRAMLDFRETPALHRAGGGGLGLLREALAGAGLERDVELRAVMEAAPLFTDPGHEGVRRLASLGSRLAGAPWYCDAGRLAEGGIASVACGPGHIAQAHTEDEFLAVADLEAGVELYRRLLESYAA